jgi:hypothetical protein
VRFALEGVRAPIVATVAKRRADGLVLVQKLPFLKRHSLVCDEAQRPARIARVALDSGRDVPELVIELAYDDPTPVSETISTRAEDITWTDLPTRRDATVPYEQHHPSTAGATLVRPERKTKSTRPSLGLRLRAAFRAFTNP